MAAGLLVKPLALAAAEDVCNQSADLGYAGTRCEVAPAEAKEKLGSPRPGGGTYTSYRYVLHCTHDRVADEDGPACVPCPEGEGDRFTLQAREVVGGVARGEWRVEGEVCLTRADIEEIDGQRLTPAVVMSEFRKLEWPRAELTVQPPGGETLVNRATFAFTSDPGPILKELNLLGQRIDVEASALSWTWRWGDGVEAITRSPGGPYPDGDVSHVYRKAGVTVRVRVDVTYVGRFRVGGGEWQGLPDSHMVPGVAESLSVREAIPQLVR